MAVRTSHLAFCDLVRQRFPRNSGLNESAHIRLFVTKMVEVKDIGI